MDPYPTFLLFQAILKATLGYIGSMLRRLGLIFIRTFMKRVKKGALFGLAKLM